METTNLSRNHGNMDMTHKPSVLYVGITLEVYQVCVCGLRAIGEWNGKRRSAGFTKCVLFTSQLRETAPM